MRAQDDCGGWRQGNWAFSTSKHRTHMEQLLVPCGGLGVSSLNQPVMGWSLPWKWCPQIHDLYCSCPDSVNWINFRWGRNTVAIDKVWLGSYCWVHSFCTTSEQGGQSVRAENGNCCLGLGTEKVKGTGAKLHAHQGLWWHRKTISIRSE